MKTLAVSAKKMNNENNSLPQAMAGKRFLVLVTACICLLLHGYNLDAQVKDCKSPCNLLKNGNFEAGMTGFSSDLQMGCASCTDGCVKVVSKFSDKCDKWPATGSGSGQFLAVDGSPSANNKMIWKKDISACCGITYTFSFRAANIFGTAGSENITLMVNGAPICTVTVNSTDWKTYTCTYTGCVNSIALRQDKGAAKSDIGIDDIFFGFCSCDCHIQ